MRERPPTFRINRNATLAKGLVFAGLGGGASTLMLADSSGYGNHGTLTNMDPPTDWVWVPELGRWGLGGFSNTAYVDISQNNLTNLPTQYPFSVSFWARKDTLTINPVALAWYGTDDILFYVCETSYGTRVYWRDCGANQLEAVFDDYTGQWHHYLCVFTNGRQSFYIDANWCGTETNSLANAGPFTGMRLGNWADNPAYQNFVGGSLADVMMFSGAMDWAAGMLADPSNILLSGLILPPRRTIFAAVSATPITGGSLIGSSVLVGGNKLVSNGVLISG